MPHSTFVRALWGDDLVERRDRILRQIELSLRQPHQPSPCLVYAFGVENNRWLADRGLTTVLASEQPVVNYFGAERRDPGPMGVRNFGCDMWTMKIDAMIRAMRDEGHDEIVWLDWDTVLQEPLPPDFWDVLRRGAPIQATLVQFHNMQARYREQDPRKGIEGAFIYCRSLEIMESVWDLYRQHPLCVDQKIVAWTIDRLAGGWPGVEGWLALGHEPYCHVVEHIIHEPRRPLFVTAKAKRHGRGHKRESAAALKQKGL